MMMVDSAFGSVDGSTRAPEGRRYYKMILFRKRRGSCLFFVDGF